MDMDTIGQREGDNLTAKTFDPTTFPNAGVTVGVGVDLGAQTATGLANMGVPSGIITTLTPYLTLKGSAAVSYLSSHPLTLSSADANTLSSAVLSSYFNAVGLAYSNKSDNFMFTDLPWQAQTVLADLWYNSGNLATSAPGLWTEMANGDWDSAYSNLENNYSNKDHALNQRAIADGDLLKQAIDNCSMPSS